MRFARPPGRQGRLTIVINPIAGTGGRPDLAARRVRLAADLIARHDMTARIVPTTGIGHARALAAEAVAQGADLVIAWGGDGTINEVASALAFGTTSLGIVPSGSGNGLARALGIPSDPASALAVALGGRDRRIDCGELDGHLFFNIAGVGLDARVAHAFAHGGLKRRGFLRYIQLALRELYQLVPDDYVIITDEETRRQRAMLIAIANGTQYGNGAMIAPGARFDDGRLDVVVVGQRSRLRAVLQMPSLVTGRVATIPGITVHQVASVEIQGAAPLLYHVDGEPRAGGTSLVGRVHPGALTVRTP